MSCASLASKLDYLARIYLWQLNKCWSTNKLTWQRSWWHVVRPCLIFLPTSKNGAPCAPNGIDVRTKSAETIKSDTLEVIIGNITD